MIRAVPLVVALLGISTACGGGDVAPDPDPDLEDTEGGDTEPAAFPPLQVSIEEVSDIGDDPLVQHEVRLMAAGVARRRRGEHGALPEMVASQDDTAADEWPKVTIRNDTQHGLVVWFAGPCPRTVALAATGEHTVELCEGTYDIAAQLSADDFLPFVGEDEEVENGYGYSLAFYVVAEPRTRVRRRGRR